MNDSQIRTSFHRKCLNRHHCDSATLVVDELGLQHGKCRADIAVINGHLIGYEIKSDADSLRRLEYQIDSYNAVFDYVSAIVATRHLDEAEDMLPEWWGVISVCEGRHGAIHFRTVRRSKRNVHVDNYAITQLLWRDEAQEILVSLGIRGKLLREGRANLYRCVVDRLDSRRLRETVREYLVKRENWRHHVSLSPSDGLFQPSATS